MNIHTSLIGLCLLACCSVAQPIRVLTLDSSRSGVCGGIDYNILTGDAFAAVRGAMDNPGNFGDGGVVDREIAWAAQVPVVTRGALQTCDVVLLSSNVTRLDVCERRALLEFVDAGGGVFMFSNGAIQQFGLPLGATPASANGSGNGLITDESSPVTDGPFGAVTGTLFMAFHRGFDAVGPNGSAFVASDIDYGATFEVGAGRSVLYGDEESFMAISENGCAAGTLTNKELAIFLNTVAFVAPDPGFEFTGSGECCPADANQDGDVNTLDVLTFLNQWSGVDPFADINGDGSVNTQDVLAFLNLWNAGC